MRLTKLILFLAALLLLLPGTALAEPQEQLFLHQVSVGSFDVWQHTDGRWQDTDHDGEVDPYGQTNKTLKPEVLTLPQTQYTNGFTVTRVDVVKMDGSFTMTDEELKNAGRSESWDYFNRNYLRKLPNNYSATKTGEDLAQGTVTIKKTLDLMPKSLNLKDPAVRAELGMADQDFSDMAQGWRWYTPVLIEWYGVPKQVVQPPNNLAVTITSNPEDAQQSEAVTVTGEITSDSETPVTTLAQWYLDSKKVFEGEVTINKKRNLTFPFSMPNKDTLVTVQVNPGRDKPSNETTWEDNKDKAMIQLAAAPAQGNSQLILTAKSQGGKDMSGKYVPPQQRPAGTAKWTDTVTALLKTPTPTPPKGTLKSWSITSAKLTYPKKNERFSFGSPYPPQGTVTVNMTNGGHTSTVTFKQDWGMDGAKIYSQFEQKLMAAKKKPYPITATYTIKYTYEYKVKHRSCKKTSSGKRSCHTWYETKTGTGTDSGTATAQLLVNGTGVNSLSN